MSEIDDFDLYFGKSKGETLPWVIAKEMISKLLSFASDDEEEEIISSWGFKEELKLLHETAEMVQDLLFDATTKRGTPFNVIAGFWVEELNALAYEADAVLEEFNYQTLRLKLEINPNMDELRQQFRLKITSINKSLDEIYKLGTRFGLIRLQGVKDALVEHTAIRLTYPYVDDSEVLGREGEVSFIVAILCSSGENEEHLSVLAIVGMGGVGKTTLARLVCNHDKVVRHFDEMVWITVSEDFDVTRILNDMIQSLTGKNPRLSNVNEIVKNELGRRLRGKKVFTCIRRCMESGS
ncbi:hypothetical protein LguiA_029170 [Lonicera macranthoides]